VEDTMLFAFPYSSRYTLPTSVHFKASVGKDEMYLALRNRFRAVVLPLSST